MSFVSLAVRNMEEITHGKHDMNRPNSGLLFQQMASHKRSNDKQSLSSFIPVLNMRG